MEFQLVVLARVIVDSDQVTLTATGITKLVKMLQSSDDNVVILAGNLHFLQKNDICCHASPQ